MAKIPCRKQWSWNEVTMARDGVFIFYQGTDFDNIFDIRCLNPKAHSIEQRFTAKRKTSNTLEDAPMWYPGRRLKQQLKKARKEAEERRRQQRIRYEDLHKPFAI